MQNQDTMNRHAALVDHMADKLGVDVEESMMKGLLSPEELSDAVLRCTGCSNPNDCQHWLADHTAPQAQTPDYCRNQDLFHALRGDQGS